VSVTLDPDVPMLNPAADCFAEGATRADAKRSRGFNRDVGRAGGAGAVARAGPHDAHRLG